MKLLATIAAHALHRPHQVALLGEDESFSYVDLQTAISILGQQLVQRGVRTLGLDMDNCPAWALTDLAALAAGVCLVPLPPFFSDAQLRHCLHQAGVQAVISDRPEELYRRAGLQPPTHIDSIRIGRREFAWLNLATEVEGPPDSVVKLTYTSGTTGEPKGVMLARDSLDAVAASLAGAVSPQPGERHLALMPLAVLLENIAGLYVPLLGGATAILPGTQQVGMLGAARVDARCMLDALLHWAASSALFTPQTLSLLLDAIETSGRRPRLRFAALGGAVSSLRLLQRAERLGIPVFEGYGVSEAASVITLNVPGGKRTGSVGKPLPHLELRVSECGEIQIRGPLFRGYLAQDPVHTDDWWSTGDIGRIDEDGFVHLMGRHRNFFVTAFGRNVSPEWVEAELCAEAAVMQAAVFGEARPFNTALLVAAPGADTSHIERAVAQANARLPDYARIGRWLYASQPFTPHNGQLSSNGRLRREQVEAVYGGLIAAQYQQEKVS